MAFGKGGSSSVQDEAENSVSEEVVAVSDDEVEEIDVTKKPTEHKPLLQEVEFMGAANSKNAGGSKVWRCKHCNHTSTSSYTRIHVHFFGPPAGQKANIKRCTLVNKDREKYTQLVKRVKEAEKVGVSKSLKNSLTSGKQTFSSSKKIVEQTYGVLERNQVDLKVIRGLCADRIPFNVLRNPQFLEMAYALAHAPKGYVLPSSEKARTTLLDECYRDVDKELVPVKDTWYSQGASIVSDGWTNVKHKPLINVLAVNSRGAMFMYAEDFSGLEKTGVAIANYLLEAIEMVGPSNVIQVVTDNAANYKAAGKEVEKVHKHIFWSPCCVHTLNLVFKDFAKEFDWLMSTYTRGKVIVKFFINHGNALHAFRENSDLELLKVSKTRFASHYTLLDRLLKCREALATVVSFNSWRDWVRKCDETTKTLAGNVVETIRNEEFWDNVENILSVTKPLYLMIKFADGEGPKMGEIYEKMDNMVGEIKDAMLESKFASDYPQANSILQARWEKMTIPLHCLGFALSPKFYDKDYLSTPAPGGDPRKAPNKDVEVIQGVMEAFKKIAESPTEEKKLRDQFAKFHMKKGLFSMAAVQGDAATMDAIDWWSSYGSETPDLAEVAMKILSQPISSSSAERIWSTYSYIHSVKRNRLNTKRADRLVFIHSNIRLVSRFTDAYKNGPTKHWDVDPENDYLEGPSTRYEEEKDKLKGKRKRTD